MICSRIISEVSVMSQKKFTTSMSMGPTLGTTLGHAFVKNGLTYVQLHLKQRCIKDMSMTSIYVFIHITLKCLWTIYLPMFTEQNITTFSFFNMTLIINTVYRNNDLRPYPSQRCNEFRLLIRACVYLLKVSI